MRDFVHCPPGTAHVFVGAGDASLCDLHGGPSHSGQGHRVPALQTRPPSRRGRRDGDELTRRGLRAVPALAARAPAAGRTALGLVVPAATVPSQGT